MILKSNNGKKFIIYDINWHYLMGLLTHDMTSESNRVLSLTSSFVTNKEGKRISKEIKGILTNNKVYEVWDGVKVEPLINPTEDVVENWGSHIQPITEKRLEFLNRLVDFLEHQHASLKIEH